MLNFDRDFQTPENEPSESASEEQPRSEIPQITIHDPEQNPIIKSDSSGSSTETEMSSPFQFLFVKREKPLFLKV
jgi:hypothetical protein